jgi:subtilisin-like proprotein convertase family protein
VASKSGDCVGAFSAPFKFATTFCGTSNALDLPIIIPASGTPTVESNLTIPNTSNVVINDVNVSINISHTWINDLTVSLISPNGTIVQLFTNQCSATAAGFQNAIATFDDASTLTLVCGSTPPSVSGRVIPLQPLSAFNGQNSQGIWKLRVFDKANLDGGQINSWNLEICSNQAPLSISNANKIDFAVYPNPNNGSFNIKMDNLISDKVSIVVYDMRGRTIFNKDYKSQASFNQNIQLDTIQSGVYLLNVIDGDRKETKRIVIQ